jgi:hypothetical protein
MGTIGEKYVYMVARYFATNNLQLVFHRDLPYQVALTNGDVSGQNRLTVFGDPYQMDL